MTKIKNIRNSLIAIGDEAKINYDQTKDLSAALVAIKAYSEVTKTAVAQVRYKSQVGSPVKIDFLEE
jgi:hypothetical protein